MTTNQPSIYSAITHLNCVQCGTSYSPSQVLNTCHQPGCHGFLWAEYDLAKLSSELTPVDLLSRPHTMWRYHELLPVLQPENVISMDEGMTPLRSLKKLGNFFGLPRLYLKDESLNPGLTFKARGASCGISKAVEQGVSTIGMGTNGNAGEAWAIYGAKAGVKTVIIMPADTKNTAKDVSQLVGANVFGIKGYISDASRLIEQGARAGKWLNVSSFNEPYRLEGKKTLGFEILEQLAWKVPNTIIFPTGGGVALIAVYKACKELIELGWIPARLPRLVSVQAYGCAPIVKAFHEGNSVSETVVSPWTIASGLRVPKSRADDLVLKAIYESNGTAITVTDEAIKESIELIAKHEGLLICPEAAAGVAALSLLKEQRWLQKEEDIVLLGTGSLFKYPNLLSSDLRIIENDDSALATVVI